MVTGINKAINGCALVNLDVAVYDTTSAKVTLTGTRLSGPATGLGEQVSYTRTVNNVSCSGGSPGNPCACPGAVNGHCAVVPDLAPGLWRHEICVDTTSGT